MTLEQLADALDRYGGDMARWPDDLRREADTLAYQNPLAAQRIAEARRLAGILVRAVAPAPVDAALMGRIVAHAHGNNGVMLRPTRRLIGWTSAAIAASLIAGFVVGVALPASQGEDVMAELVFGESATSSSTGDLL